MGPIQGLWECFGGPLEAFGGGCRGVYMEWGRAILEFLKQSSERFNGANFGPKLARNPPKISVIRTVARWGPSFRDCITPLAGNL